MSKTKQAPTQTAETTEQNNRVADLWDTTSKASDLHHLKKLKVFISGPSGSGKTRIISMFKRVLIGLTEHQAVPTIMEHNPDAIIKLIHGPKELMEFKEMIRDPSLAERVDCVALDSLTDAQRILKSYYTDKQSSGKTVTELQTWGLLIDATSRLAREVRDLPVHVVVTCLDEEETVEGVGRIHRPAVSGKRLPNDLAQYFNLVGFSYVQEQERGMRHEVMFRGPDRWLTKAMSALNDVEPPEPELWIAKVFGGKVSAEVRSRCLAWKELATTSDTETKASEEAKGDDT